jgi:dTDP-4-dehydrorhamnose reductase
MMLGHKGTCEVLNTSHHRRFVLDHQLFDYTQLDITNKGDVKSLVSSYRPDVIINTAAMSHVDACEHHKEIAWKINVTGVEHLVEVARRLDAQLIHLSTDYVFDGAHGPYAETDRPHPINYYGRTKLAGENAVLAGLDCFAIVRTIVLYGNGIGVKENFALWVINSLKAGKAIRCATDQIGNPTFVGDLAGAIIQIVDRASTGIYHLCGPETASRYDFSLRIAAMFNLDADLIRPVASAELGQDAPRPLRTGFRIEKACNDLGFHPLSINEGLTALQRELEHLTVN